MPTGVYKRTPQMKTGQHMKGKTAWNKGIKHTVKQIEKMSGKNNSIWKGGVTLGENRPSYIKNYNKEYRRRIRISVLEILGGKCIKCNFEDKRALQIDHIKGGGNRERKEKRFLGQGKQYYKEVMESVLKQENKYQLLCANCNWIKKHDEHEHKWNQQVI